MQHAIGSSIHPIGPRRSGSILTTARYIGAAAIAAVVLAACGTTSSTPPSSTNASVTSTTPTTPPGSGSGGSGTAVVSSVWPSCCSITYTAMGNSYAAVGKAVLQIGAQGGTGSTVTLVSSLGAFGNAVATTQQAVARAMATVAPSAAGYGQLAALETSLQQLASLTTSAQGACGSANNACLKAVTQTESVLKAANSHAANLNGVTGAP